jgi:hypothetical protein
MTALQRSKKKPPSRQYSIEEVDGEMQLAVACSIPLVQRRLEFVERAAHAKSETLGRLWRSQCRKRGDGKLEDCHLLTCTNDATIEEGPLKEYTTHGQE